jgi:hypothetical protein
MSQYEELKKSSSHVYRQVGLDISRKKEGKKKKKQASKQTSQDYCISLYSISLCNSSSIVGRRPGIYNFGLTSVFGILGSCGRHLNSMSCTQNFQIAQEATCKSAVAHKKPTRPNRQLHPLQSAFFVPEKNHLSVF